MNVNKATIADLNDLLALDADLRAYRLTISKEDNKSFHERTVPHELFNKDKLTKSIVFIARGDDNEPLGFIRGTIEKRDQHVLSTLGYIDELFVSENARGKRVARQLFEMLESEFQKQGCDHMTNHTDAENSLSRNFYKKVGMNEVTVEFWKKIKNDYTTI